MEDADRLFLRRCGNVGATFLIRFGYHNLFRVVIPRMRRCSRAARSRFDRRLSSGAFTILGNLFIYLNAPRSALVWYRRATLLDGSLFEARAGAALVLYMIGRYREGLAVQKRLKPACIEERSDFDGVECERTAFLARKCPLFVNSDVTWRGAEYLARYMPYSALEALSRKRQSDARIWRARALAAVGERKRMLAEWQTVLREHPYLSAADWFFLDDDAWNDPFIWKSVLEIIGNVGYLGLGFRSLPLTYGDSKREKRRDAQVGADIVKYHLARCTADGSALLRLSAKYPTWKEPRRALRRLKHRSTDVAISAADKGLAGFPPVPPDVLARWRRHMGENGGEKSGRKGRKGGEKGTQLV